MPLGPPWFPVPSTYAIDDVVFRLVPDPPLVELVGVLTATDRAGMWTLVLLTDPTQHAELLAVLDARRVRHDTMENLADELVEPYLGMPRYAAAVLWRRVVESWQAVDGLLSSRGVDLLALPPARACNAAVGVFREFHQHDSDAWKKWMNSLTRKPADVLRRQQLRTRARETSATAAEQSTMAALRMLGGDLSMLEAASDPAPPAGDSQVILHSRDTLDPE